MDLDLSEEEDPSRSWISENEYLVIVDSEFILDKVNLFGLGK